jgi:hypothetical protein
MQVLWDVAPCWLVNSYRRSEKIGGSVYRDEVVLDNPAIRRNALQTSILINTNVRAPNLTLFQCFGL